MISPAAFIDHLSDLGVTKFLGVPDSLLKPLSKYVMEELPRERHVITADEGAAVGMALGHFMRTSTPALVYLQNSGIGNTINPLLSLADSEVYGVPMVLVVGWRGQPGVADEPQHVKQGRVMTALMEAMEIPYAVLPTDQNAALEAATTAVRTATATSAPYVLLVEKGTFETLPGNDAVDPAVEALASRESALSAVAQLIADDSIIVSTTGMLSRELFELREQDGSDSTRDFLTVGGMGHASAIALGIAHCGTEQDVWCLDGDGALLMHMGTMATIADHGPQNFFHVVFNNSVHDSVGGQPTSIGVVDIPAAATSMGYRWSASTSDLSVLPDLMAEMTAVPGPALLEIKVKPGSRKDLGRPTRTPRESRDRFIDAIGVR